VQLQESIGKRPGMARRHQKAGHAVDHRVPDSADVAADHRPRRGHGFKRRDAERLVPRRRHEHVAGGVISGELAALPMAGEGHSVGDAAGIGKIDKSLHLVGAQPAGRSGVVAL